LQLSKPYFPEAAKQEAHPELIFALLDKHWVYLSSWNPWKMEKLDFPHFAANCGKLPAAVPGPSCCIAAASAAEH